MRRLGIKLSPQTHGCMVILEPCSIQHQILVDNSFPAKWRSMCKCSVHVDRHPSLLAVWIGVVIAVWQTNNCLNLHVQHHPCVHCC